MLQLLEALRTGASDEEVTTARHALLTKVAPELNPGLNPGLDPTSDMPSPRRQGQAGGRRGSGGSGSPLGQLPSPKQQQPQQQPPPLPSQPQQQRQRAMTASAAMNSLAGAPSVLETAPTEREAAEPAAATVDLQPRQSPEGGAAGAGQPLAKSLTAANSVGLAVQEVPPGHTPWDMPAEQLTPRGREAAPMQRGGVAAVRTSPRGLAKAGEADEAADMLLPPPSPRAAALASETAAALERAAKSELAFRRSDRERSPRRGDKLRSPRTIGKSLAPSEAAPAKAPASAAAAVTAAAAVLVARPKPGGGSASSGSTHRRSIRCAAGSDSLAGSSNSGFVSPSSVSSQATSSHTDVELTLSPRVDAIPPAKPKRRTPRPAALAPAPVPAPTTPMQVPPVPAAAPLQPPAQPPTAAQGNDIAPGADAGGAADAVSGSAAASAAALAANGAAAAAGQPPEHLAPGSQNDAEDYKHPAVRAASVSSNPCSRASALHDSKAHTQNRCASSTPKHAPGLRNSASTWSRVRFRRFGMVNRREEDIQLLARSLCYKCCKSVDNSCCAGSGGGVCAGVVGACQVQRRQRQTADAPQQLERVGPHPFNSLKARIDSTGVAALPVHQPAVPHGAAAVAADAPARVLLTCCPRQPQVSLCPRDLVR